MIETPMGNIYGIEDETITMLELKQLFKAIKDGKIKKIVFNEVLKRKEYDVRIVTMCKDCKNSIDPCGGWDRRCKTYGVVRDDFFCGDGKPKDGVTE